MGGAKAHYDGIVAFSQTDFSEDLKRIDIPVLVMHGDDDQIVPYENSGVRSGEAAAQRHAEDLSGLPARDADHPGRGDQRRPAGVHPRLSVTAAGQACPAATTEPVDGKKSIDLEVHFNLIVGPLSLRGSPMNLFDPLSLPNGSTLPNRIAKAAMEENMADAGQAPSEALMRLYQAWADGGAGLLISGNVMIDSRAMTGPGGVVLEDDAQLEKFRRWARIGRSAGAQFWLQINHPAGRCRPTSASRPGRPRRCRWSWAGCRSTSPRRGRWTRR
ncbi:FMN oxidoreductase [Pseudomonas aeruginosa]|nr:FMN oxidoreductase [Pseudomonas aeruginosa]